MTLPLGLLHAGLSPRESCHPSIPLGCGLGGTFTFLHFSVNFLRAFAMEQRCCKALHGWETAALDGEVPFPKKRGLVVGFAAGFAVVEFAAVSSLSPPAVFESSGAPKPSLLLHPSFSASCGSQAAPSDDLQDQLTYERPSVSPSRLCFPSSPKGIPFSLQISSKRCGRRGGEVSHCNSQESTGSCSDLDRDLGTGTSISPGLWQGAVTTLRLLL